MLGGMSSSSILPFLLLPLTLVLSHSLEADSKSSCRESERDALLKFKEGLVNPSNLSISWVGEDCCLWHGVGCSNTSGHVLMLDLVNEELTGEISTSLLNLTYLNYLDLSINNFSGSIPNSLAQFQRLEYLYLGNNFLWGPIPDSIGRLSGLRHLSLENNLLNGSIPMSIGQLSNLERLDLRTNLLEGSIPPSLGKLSKLVSLEIENNSLNGIVSENHFRQLKSLTVLRMSDNSLVFDIDPNWIAPFQLQSIFLSSCNVGPKFPQWLKSQTNKSLAFLDLYNASIYGSIPDWFENISSNIQYLDLSYNLITSHLPKFGAPSESSIDRFISLTSNMIEGPFIAFPSSTVELDISNNLLSGQIPQMIGNIMPGLCYLSLSNNLLNGIIPSSLCDIKNLNILDLSMNRLSGEIPQCWEKIENLEVLDLGNNNLSGHIPVSLGSLFYLKTLHLEKNNLRGEVPASLGNLRYLLTLDLSENSFVGSICPWVSDSLEYLQILSIHSNKFNGEIPPKICHLVSLRILNLGNNKMTGTIPHCLEKFAHNSTFKLLPSYFGSIPYDEHVWSFMKGRELKYHETTLELLYSINLSENNFFGEIPTELMNISMLQSLNLSGNNLTGNIPPNIGKLRSLESLDLSRNKFSGSIPSSISELNFLSFLNLSFNNLSGAIPLGSQLQTLDDKSIYIGNFGLCGPPLGTCQGEEIVLPKHPEAAAECDEHGYDSELIWFYCGLSMGFFSGFVGFCVALYFCDSWRYACFRLADKIYNKLWVIVVIKRNQIRRKLKMPINIWSAS